MLNLKLNKINYTYLQDLCYITSGNNTPNEENGKYYNLTMGSVTEDGKLVGTLKTNKTNKLLSKNSLIMPTRDVGVGLIIGRTAYIPRNNFYYAGNCLYILTPKIKINMKYLNFIINSDYVRNQFKKKITGSSQKQITLSDVYSIKIPILSIEEQQKISTFLSAFDLKIEHESQIIEQLKQLKKSLLYKMFPTENSNIPELRFKGFTDVWEQRELKELGKILTGSTPSTSNPNYYSKIGIPWVTPTDIKSVTISETPRKLSKEGENIGRIVPANTILCTCIASIGKNTLLTVKGSFNQQINSLTPNKENNAYFLLTESNFWSDKMKKITTSGMMQIINKSEFSNLQTMIPILKEQEKIGELFSKIDSLITLHQRKYNYFLSIIVNIYQINN